MSDSENREFIRETIMDKATGRRYRVRRFLKLLAAAVFFGLVAALFFVLGQRFFQPHLNPQENLEEPIYIGRDPEEEQRTEESPEGETQSSPAESETQGETTESESAPEQTQEAETEETAEDEWGEVLQEMVSSAVSEEFESAQDTMALAWYQKVSEVYRSISQGLVTISSVRQDTDWFNNPVSNADQSAGAIIYMTDAEVLILADYSAIEEAEALTVTFSGGDTVEARVKKTDRITGIAIISVSLGAVSQEVLDSLEPLVLGNSYQVTAATPVIGAGSPAGFSGSVVTGMVSYVQRNAVGTDTAFQLLYADLSVEEDGGGFLFNVNGEIIGILTDTYGDETVEMPAAIGISSLKGIIESLSSGIDVAYLGIQGQNATAQIAETGGMPEGIYVTRVIMDSPAYLAGLKAGDIITASGEEDILTMRKLQSFLESYSTGDVITLTVYRSGADEYVEMEFEVTLAAR